MNLDATAVIDCALGEEGEELVEKAFADTAALAVPHKWVPWLVVNDKAVTKFHKETSLKHMICTRIDEAER